MRIFTTCLLIVVAGSTLASGQDATRARKAKKPSAPEKYDASVPGNEIDYFFRNSQAMLLRSPSRVIRTVELSIDIFTDN